MDNKIAIIGAGISGLYLANLLLSRGFKVDIYDKKRDIGVPQHCAGIVSNVTIKLLGRIFSMRELYSNFVINRINALNLIIDSNLNKLYTNTKSVYILDRKLLEKALAEYIEASGGKIYLNKRVNFKVRNNLLLLRDDAILAGNYAYYVVAIGALGALLRCGKSTNILSALQYDLTGNVDGDYIEVYIDKSINRHFFFWKIPLNDRIVRVGTAGKFPYSLLKCYLTRKYVGKIDFKVVSKYLGYVVLTGPILPFADFRYRHLYIGDTAGQTKVSTGGGILYSLVAATILCSCIEMGNIKEYQKLWLSLFKREISLQKILRSLFLHLNNEHLSRLVKLLDKRKFISSFLSCGNVDFHATNFLKSIFKI